ncbi:MAG: ankyrin repeat domain-containing protein [Bacteroidales bacterium]
MLSTRILSSLAILVFFFLSSFNRVLGQTGEVIDTSGYVPWDYAGALDYNLMIAASMGYDSEVVKFLKKGADVDTVFENGATPLIYAIANNHLSTVRVLLSYSANVDEPAYDRQTPLMIAVRNKNPEITEALIAAGADLEKTDINGATALHLAAISGAFTETDMLLYYGADCNKKTLDGTTPLMAAIWAGYDDIADLLIQNGANMEAQDNEGFTPFLIASQSNDTLMINLLLKEGVNLYEKNSYNYDALDLAIESDNKDAVRLLLGKGKLWNSGDNKAVSPYTVASAFHRSGMVKILEAENVPGHVAPRINEMAISASARLTFKDFYSGIGLSFKEPLLNAGFFAGCDFKPFYTKVLMKAASDFYYQYMDRSSFIYAGIFKDFTIHESFTGTRFAISPAVAGGWTFGNNFKGTNISPESKFRIMPSLTFRIQKNHFQFFTGVDYIRTEFYHIGPVWMRVGCSYNMFMNTVRSPRKLIKWF